MAPDARNPEVDASESGEKRSLLASLNTLDIKPDVPKKQRKKRVRGQPWPVSDSRVIEYIPARNWRRRPRKAVSIDTEVANRQLATTLTLVVPAKLQPRNSTRVRVPFRAL